MTDNTGKQWEFIELRSKGNSFDTISKKIGVSKGTLIKWSRDFNDDVVNYTAIEREKLIEAAKLSKQHQITTLGEHLETIRNELAKRDLSSISTSKLIEIELKIIEAANKIGTDTIMQINEDGVFASFTKEIKWAA